MSAAPLKYVRTTQGFLVFPCLVTTHKDAAGSTGWPILSAGMVEWDIDGRPLCMGKSDTLGIGSREDDTDALRAEWGMTTERPLFNLVVSSNALADVHKFSNGMPDVPPESQEQAL